MEVLDWKVMKNGGGRILVSKKLVLYGSSSSGDKMVTYLQDLEMMQNLVAVFDSNPQKWGVKWNGYQINPPEKLKQMSEDICILITSDFIADIFKSLLDMEIPQKYVLSGVCFRLGIHFDIMNGNATQYWSEKFINDYKKKYNAIKTLPLDWKYALADKVQAELQTAIASFPACILLDGMTKTGNCTLDLSFDKVQHVVFTHHFSYYGEKHSLESLQNIMKNFPNHKIRIITGIREPIERIISMMWQELYIPCVYQDKCFTSLISATNSANFIEGIVKDRTVSTEEWFHKHIELAFGIDVFSAPFDTEKGYTIFSKGNVSVFVYRLDFLNLLEKEIGEFTHVKNFKLSRKNSAKNKEYALAYQDYLKEVKVKRAFFEELMNSALMQHFYTEQERENYRKKWEAKLCD